MYEGDSSNKINQLINTNYLLEADSSVCAPLFELIWANPLGRFDRTYVRMWVEIVDRIVTNRSKAVP